MTVQGSPEWRQQRSGFITASRFADATSLLKGGGSSAARTNYLLDVATERITGRPVEAFVNTAMRWGSENEFDAISAYAGKARVAVIHLGFVESMDLDYVGCSPDGLVGNDGLIEAKCPYEPSNHMATIAGGMPEKHRAQVQGQLWIMQREWCDFVSFDPRNEPPYDIFIQRQYRDEGYIATLEVGIIAALEEVEQILERIQQKAGV